MKFSKQIFLTCALLFIFSSSCFALEPAVFEAITPLPSQVSEGEPVYVEYRLKNPNYTPISVIVLLNQLPGVYITTIGCSIGSTYPARISDYDYCILGFTFTAPFLSSGAYSKVWATAQTSGFDPVSLTVSTQIIPTLTVIPIVEPKGCKACTGTTSPGAVFVYNGNSTSFSLNPRAGAVISGVSGSCGGTLTGSIFTTSAITKDCNVYVAFIQEYSQGITRGSGPYGITAGSGGIWFTELLGNRIGKINTVTGDITEYAIPTTDSEPNGITYGSNGNVWFTEFKGNKIGEITPSGVITEYPIPTENSQPFGITQYDDNLWFTEQAGNKIGEMSLSGAMIAEYAVPTADSEPAGIIWGRRDGNGWFTEYRGNKIGKITPEGVITEYPIPTEKSHPVDIVEGSIYGGTWFTESTGNSIGTITTKGIITEYPIPTKGVGSYGITSECPACFYLNADASDLWFTESTGNKIGKITEKGVITEYPTPAGDHDLYGITWGSDGNLWFTEGMGNKIGVL